MRHTRTQCRDLLCCKCATLLLQRDAVSLPSTTPVAASASASASALALATTTKPAAATAATAYDDIRRRRRRRPSGPAGRPRDRNPDGTEGSGKGGKGREEGAQSERVKDTEEDRSKRESASHSDAHRSPLGRFPVYFAPFRHSCHTPLSLFSLFSRQTACPADATYQARGRKRSRRPSRSLRFGRAAQPYSRPAQVGGNKPPSRTARRESGPPSPRVDRDESSCNMRPHLTTPRHPTPYSSTPNPNPRQA